jgi:hypothetical protein
VPLDVFADLHKKNPVIFEMKIAGFLHKNQLARGMNMFCSGSIFDF